MQVLRVVLEWEGKFYVVFIMNEHKSGIYTSASWNIGHPDIHTSYHADGSFNFSKSDKNSRFSTVRKEKISAIKEVQHMPTVAIPLNSNLNSLFKTIPKPLKADIFIRNEELNIYPSIVRKSEANKFKRNLKKQTRKVSEFKLTFFKNHVVIIGY